MVDTARHTLYKTRLTEHVHADQTKQYINRNIQTQEKQNIYIIQFQMVGNSMCEARRLFVTTCKEQIHS